MVYSAVNFTVRIHIALYSLYGCDMFLGTFNSMYGIIRHNYHNSYTLQQKSYKIK